MAKTFSDFSYERSLASATKAVYWDDVMKTTQFGRGQAGDIMLGMLDRFMPKGTKATLSLDVNGKMTVYGTRRIKGDKHFKQEFEMNIVDAYGAEGMVKFDAEMKKLVDYLLEQK